MFAKFLAQKKSFNRDPIVHVMGDIMIDQYYNISAERLSPEFPIPIYVSKEEQPTYTLPGGAANVANQMRELGANVCLFSFINSYAKTVLEAHGVGYCDMRMDFDFQVPLKRRLYYGNFPLCRWDIEQAQYGANNLDGCRQRISKSFADYEKSDPSCQSDAIILSDYNKGFFEDRIDIERWIDCKWREKKPLIVVDPKRGPATKWKGCDVFKPNRKEAKELSGFNDIKDQLRKLQEETEAKMVIITCEGDGVVGWHNDFFEYRPNTKIEANSVIGAGDCFVAVLTLGLVYGLNCYEAVAAAFSAGTVYVKNKRNQPISLKDLLVVS